MDVHPPAESSVAVLENTPVQRSGARRLIPWIALLIYTGFLWNSGGNFKNLSQLDLGSFYWGAKLTFAEHHSPYDLSAMDGLTKSTGQKVFPYLYPPPSLLLFAPLATMSYKTAAVAMVLVNHICVLLIICTLFCGILKFSLKQLFAEYLPAMLLVYFISSHAVALTIDYGQVNLIVLALLCLSWWAIKREAAAWKIALPLALAIILKTYPAIFLVLLLIRRQYFAIAWTCAMLTIAAGVSYVALPPRLWHDWLAVVAPTGGFCRIPFGLHSPACVPNQGINGFVSRLCMTTDAGPALLQSRSICVAIGYALSAGVLGATLMACRASARRSPGNIDAEFSTFLIASFLVAPLAWEHHLVFIAPAIIIAMAKCVMQPGARNWPALFILIPAAIVVGYPMPLESLPLSQIPMLIVNSGKMYAVLIVWGMLIVMLIGPSAVWNALTRGLYWKDAGNHSSVPLAVAGDVRLVPADVGLRNQPIPGH